jgi:DNA invertase Pin-like site-specific DNA recombinase
VSIASAARSACASNGLRLLLPARKSRKGEGEATDYTRQTNAGVIARAERDGDKVVKIVEDTISSQTMPWERKNLRAWMNDPAKLQMWDALYVAETDRLARLDDAGFEDIEHWMRKHGKRIITGEDVQFPPRHDGDRYMWLGLKRRARTYWEDTKAKHASVREVIKANGGMIGRPPFGYMVVGEKTRKTFAIHPVNGPVAVEIFTRVSQGRTASEVAQWLTETGAIKDAKGNGKMIRAKSVIDLVKRTSYLGSRDGVEYPALVTQELWDSANAAVERRSVKTGGRRASHGYSGVIYCACSTESELVPFYFHQSTRKEAGWREREAATGEKEQGKPVGVPHYRCGRGRRGVTGESRCDYAPLGFEAANAAVGAFMEADTSWPFATITTGGDTARQNELARIKAELHAAIDAGNMVQVPTLAANLARVEAREPEPIVTRTVRRTDASVGELWSAASLTDQRSMLAERDVIVQLTPNGEVKVS